MCGIAGFVGTGNEELLEEMCSRLAHRGPDASGIWADHDVGLAHTRLSVIDLSSGAAQPMSYANGRFHLIFNGEIYNFRELKEELARLGALFKTHSDTEVILAAYAAWGTGCFRRLEGMFALALYDSDQRQLVLARDRLGKKPLYYAQVGDTLVFGSEIKALLVHPLITRTISPPALAQYLSREYVPTPQTLFAGMSKLMPGTFAVYHAGSYTQESFWRPCEEGSSSVPSESEALAKFDSLLGEAVEKRLVADVPVGIFLSGGLDSSTIAYYAARSHAVVRTFSVGFEETAFDESEQAALVARHLGTRHEQRVLTSADALALVPRIAEAFDEPIADASILPTMLLSEFTRKSVTVALGGDGADELLLGYQTFQAEAVASAYAQVPESLRALATRAADLLPTSVGYFSLDFKAKKFTHDFSIDPATRHLQWLGSFREDELLQLLAPEYRVAAMGGLAVLIAQWKDECTYDDPLNALSHLYLRTYCMDDVLVKVDRASMQYGLEVRTPFLDAALVSYVLSLPSSYKYRNGEGKQLLRALMRGRLPDSIIDRKKKGFAPPIAAWLRGPLAGLMKDLLSSERLRQQGIFEPAYVERLVTAHLAGTHDHRKKLWTLLVFQLWYDRWIN